MQSLTHEASQGQNFCSLTCDRLIHACGVGKALLCFTKIIIHALRTQQQCNMYPAVNMPLHTKRAGQGNGALDSKSGLFCNISNSFCPLQFLLSHVCCVDTTCVLRLR